MKIYHIVCHTMEQYYPELTHYQDAFFSLQHSVNDFVKALHQKDMSFEHILVNLSSSIIQEFQGIHKDGYKVIVLPGKYFFNEFLQYSNALKKFILSQADDCIFHIHGISNFLFDSIVCALSGKKVVIHHRGGHFTWKAFPLSFLKYDFLLGYHLKKFSHIIVETEYRKKEFVKKYHILPNSIFVLPGSIDYTLFTQKEKYHSQVNNILYVGRIENNKGICDLIEAFIGLQNDELILHICGEGLLLQKLKNIHSSRKNIVFHGHVSDKTELVRMYHEADICVHPSHSDSFGLSLAEALSCGVPVIATDVEGPASILTYQGKVYGELCQKGNIVQLKEKLRKTISLSVKERENIGTEGREMVKKRFSFENTFTILSKLYSSL